MLEFGDSLELGAWNLVILWGFGAWNLVLLRGLILTQSLGMAIKIVPMPTYEYVCEKCGGEFEKIQPISAKPLTVCPAEQCRQKTWGKGKVKRAISAGGGLLFKGTGFYITDYRSEKYKAAAKKDAGGGSSSSGGESKSPEAKPAKTESKPKTPPAK